MFQDENPGLMMSEFLIYVGFGVCVWFTLAALVVEVLR